MTGTEVVAQAVCRRPHAAAVGDLTALIRFTSRPGGFLLSFPRPTALAVSRRILADVPEAIDESLLRDCLGEVANVVAGQAKALLAGGPHHFAFSTPTVSSGASLDIVDSACLAVLFRGELGEFALQIF